MTNAASATPTPERSAAYLPPPIVGEGFPLTRQQYDLLDLAQLRRRKAGDLAVVALPGFVVGDILRPRDFRRR